MKTILDISADLILIMGFFGALFLLLGVIGGVLQKLFWPKG